MEFTGERFVPGERGQIKYEHLHRYALSLEFAAGKSVLDIASGEGYGAALLARVADVVTGVDVDLEAINHSKHRYYHPNLHFAVGSCQSIPLPDEAVDLVTSFETIEHHEHHEEMMQEVKRVLRPEGVLIISSPNRLVYSDEPVYSNPFHVKELYFDEFNRLLGRYFKHIRMYGQRLATGSFVYPVGEPGANIYQAFTDDNEGLRQAVASLPSPLYFIAVCSDQPLTGKPRIDSVFIDAADDLYREREAEKYELLQSLENQTRQSEAARQVNQLTEDLARLRATFEGQLELEREQSFARERQLHETAQQLRVAQQLLRDKEQELKLSELKVEECLLQLETQNHDPSETLPREQTEGLEMGERFAASPFALEPRLFDETTLRQEIERQFKEREPSLRAKDLQLEEMEQRMRIYNEAFESFEHSGFYRLSRFLKRALRRNK